MSRLEVRGRGGPEHPLGPTPFFAAGAIGVSDLDRSFAFYSSVFGMALRYQNELPGYARQKVLHFPGSKASDVVLMTYDDGQPHNYTKIRSSWCSTCRTPRS